MQVKKKEKNKISVCMYVYSVILHWDYFIELVAYESSYVNFQETFISLCLSRYVFYVCETSDIFLGTSDHCLLHHYIHWWFDYSPWLDLSRSMLIHFSFDLFVLLMVIHSSCLNCLLFILIYIPCSIFSTDHFIYPIGSSIFFFSSLSSLIHSFWILSFHHRYICIG